MKIRYSKEVDILTIELSNAMVVDSDQGDRGVIAHFGADGEIVAIEILDVSRLLDNPASLANAQG